MAQERSKTFGESLHTLMEGFHEVEGSVFATPKEKRAIKLGIIAGIKIESYIDRKSSLPFGFTLFSEGVNSFREVAKSWTDFENACIAYREYRRRTGHSTDAD